MRLSDQGVAPSYLQLVRPPGTSRLFFGSLIGRLSLGMIPVAVVLFIGQQSGSFYLAGMATGAYSIGTVVAGPARSWLSVRAGHRVALVILSTMSGTALLLVVPLGQGVGQGWPLIVLTGVAGCGSPPFGALMRVNWSKKLPEQWVPKAFGLDSIVEESSFVVGPLIVTGVIALSGAASAMTATGVVCVLGGLLMASAAERGRLLPADDARIKEHGSWATVRRLRWVLVVFAGVGFTIGAVEVIIPGFATVNGYPAFAGGLFAILALGSAIAAVLYSRRPWRISASARLIILGFLLAAVTALSAISNDLVLAIPLFVAVGVVMGPAVLTAYLLADNLVVGTAAKTHGAILASVACNGGAGAGAALAGITVADLGVWQAFLFSGVVTAILTAAGFGIHLRGGKSPMSV